MKIKIHARDILNKTEEELEKELPGSFLMIFEDSDSEHTVYKKETIFSQRTWKLMRGKYSEVKIKSVYHLLSKPIQRPTFTDMLNVILWDIVDHYNLKQDKIAELRKTSLEIINETTNYFSRTKQYAGTLHLEDLLDIAYYPPIEKLNNNVEKNELSIRTTYDKIKNIIMTDENFSNNNAISMCRNNIIKLGQVIQCIGPRGVVSDVSSEIIPKYITKGFLHGMPDESSLITESRSGATATNIQANNISISEYLARRIQLIAIVIKELEYTDCGSTDYLEYIPNNKKELECIVGKNYLSNGKLLAVKSIDKHLIGKTLLLRSVLKCKLPDSTNVCEVCFGKLSETVISEGNLGHQCVTNITCKITSKLLSTKHYDPSSVTGKITMNTVTDKYLKQSKDDDGFLLRHKPNKDAYIRFSGTTEIDELFNKMKTRKGDITANINNVLINKVFYIKTVGGKQIEIPLDLTINGRKAKISAFFAEHIKKAEVYVTESKDYVVSLYGIDKSKSIFKSPKLEYDFKILASEFEKAIESKQENITLGNDDVYETLFKIRDILNSKLEINFALIEVLVYAYCVDNHIDNRLSRFSKNPRMGVSSNIIAKRGLSAYFAYEKQMPKFLSPEIFDQQKDYELPLDHIFK